jgi:hypothetical protein
MPTSTMTILPGLIRFRRALLLSSAVAVLTQLAARADELASAPPFSIRQEGGCFWLVTPGGERFFSRGVCCVNQGVPREKHDPDNPGYAAWQHYNGPTAWAEAALGRMRAWGFTTVGGWSDFDTARASRETNFYFTPVLHIGSTAGAPWWDMWDAQVIARMDETARRQILPWRGDPRLLGYYTDNEMGWWNATLFKMTLEQPPTSGQRRRLMTLLRESYGGDWDRLLADFEPEGAASWEELDRRGMLYLRSGGQGIRVMRRFLGLLAERYYSLTRELIRKYDRRALILGDRYQSFFYPEVARAAAAHVDAISSNLNASWNDGSFLRCYLDTLHGLTGKPILVSEFYAAARENRSGNRNSRGVFPVVATQRERAAAFRRTTTDLLRLPYVIGADWFQFADEPRHGREDGENFNFGLVDIRDRPYEEVTAAAKVFRDMAAAAQPRTSGTMGRLRLIVRADATQGVPRAPRRPFDSFQPTRALKHWDRERGFVPAASEFPLADLYLCWSERALYLGLYSLDIVEDAYYRDRVVPKRDRAEWIIQPAGREAPVRARLGAGREPIVNDAALRLENLSGVNLDVRNIAAIELPARCFGQTRFRAGDTVSFTSTLWTHCQAHRVDWKGTFTLQR